VGKTPERPVLGGTFGFLDEKPVRGRQNFRVPSAVASYGELLREKDEGG
jgi:hypothetical protein